MSRGIRPAVSLRRNRRFVAFWAGQSISQLGDRISELALPLIAVVSLHASTNQVAALTALIWAPSLLAIALGAWVDHHTDTRRLMVVADVVRAVLLLTLPAAALLGAMTLAQLDVVALLTGAAAVLFNTAYPPFFVALVPRSSFLDANSKLSVSRSASFVAGPAIGGVLVQAISAPFAVMADALSFVASAVLVGRIRVRQQPAPSGDPAVASTMWRAREGLRFVVRHPVLRASLGCCTTVNFFTFMSSALLILFASRGLGLSSGAIGLAFGIGSTGGLLGAVIAPAVSRRIGVGHTVAVGAILFPAPIAIAAAAGGPFLTRVGALALAEFLSAAGVMLLDVTLNSLQASVIPDGMRSRVAGAFSTVNYGIRPIGAVAGGLLGSAIGLRATLLVAAAGGAMSVLWLLRSPIPAVRSLADVVDAVKAPVG